MKLSSVKIFILLILFSSSLFALGEDYALAWPKKVHVEKPEPVFGDENYWEHWVYSKEFAKRFKGFDIKGADAELNKNIKAIVLRVNKQDIFYVGKGTGHRKSYTCELDIYFDSKIVLPFKMTNRKRRKFTLFDRPSSYKTLTATNNIEQKILDSMVIPETRPLPESSVAIFSNPIDGRFNKFNTVEYHPNFIDGLSVIILDTGSQCRMTAPLAKGGAHWISLSGKLPLGYGATFKGSVDSKNSYRDDYEIIDFSKHPNSKLPGFNKVPNKFSNILLPKVSLIKVMNVCIQKERNSPEFKSRYVYNNEKPIRYPEFIVDDTVEIESRCADIRLHGILTDPYLFNEREDGAFYEKY